MPRSRNVYSSELPYHINVRNNDGVVYPCELKEAWDIYCNALWFCSRIFKVRILAFVMMNNHFHLLVVAPDGNLSKFMQYFQKRTSDEIRGIQGIKNHLYGDRYYPSLVGNQEYFEKVLKYIYQNPTRARICNSVLDYEFSTLKSFIGLEKMLIPIFDDFHFFDDLESNLMWLDELYDADTNALIKGGLKRQEFKPNRDKNGYMDDTLLQKHGGIKRP